MMPGLIALFVSYVVLTAWLARRALAASGEARRGEAIRLLAATFLGVPLVVAMILAL